MQRVSQSNCNPWLSDVPHDIDLDNSRRFFADILLTPLEATRIRLVSDRTYASGLTTGFARLAREGGLREMYAGFLPIICKYVLARGF